MMSDLMEMRQLLQGGTLSEAEVASLREFVDAIRRDARLSARRIGRSFALLCETFASVDSEHLPPELRAEIEAIALGRDLPEPDTSGPVTPMDLLQIATRLAAMGDRADAARLRRLADDLVSRPAPSSKAGAWTEADMAKPWGAEVAFLLNLATDPALNDVQLVMLTHCAKRISATAHIDSDVPPHPVLFGIDLAKPGSDRTVYGHTLLPEPPRPAPIPRTGGGE